MRHERISDTPELAGTFSFPEENLELLSVPQINALNRLLRGQSAETPPDPADLDEQSLDEMRHPGRARTIPKFVRGERVSLEEIRHIEFKQVVGKNTVTSIKNTADEYAVAERSGRQGVLGNC